MADRVQYEKRLKSFVGEGISRVIYFDSKTEYGTASFEYHKKPFHNVWWGVEFPMQSGRILGLLWGSQFASHGLDLYEVSSSGDFQTTDVWDVSSRDEWKPLLGKRIKSIDLYWSWWITDPDFSPPANDFRPEDVEVKHRLYYPQDIVITFETGDKVFISAAMYNQERDDFYFAADEVTIFFQETVARRYGVPCQEA